jgi:hypothetical protein
MINKVTKFPYDIGINKPVPGKSGLKWSKRPEESNTIRSCGNTYETPNNPIKAIYQNWNDKGPYSFF